MSFSSWKNSLQFSDNLKSQKLHEDMKEKQKIFRGSLRHCRKEKEKIRVDNLVGSYDSKDFGKFWQQVRQDERTSKFFSEKVEDASTPEDIAEFWKKHFESQFSDPPLNLEKCHHLIQEYKKIIPRQISNLLDYGKLNKL